MSAKTRPAEGSYTTQVEQRIREITGPLRDELRQITQRLSEIQRETEQLREARKRIEQVLKRIDPSSFVAEPKKNSRGNIGPTHVGSPEMNEERRQRVLSFLEAHRDKYDDEGIIASVVYRDMKEAGVEPIMSPEKVRVLIRGLHADGVLRADKKVRGGAMSYKLMGNSDGEA